MEYKKLGNSGLSIAPIIVGCMTYGDKGWQNWLLDNEEEIFTILKKCYDSGLRTFDTADVYSNGLSEIFLGKFIKKYNIPRDKIVILTKVWGAVDTTKPYSFNFNKIKPEEKWEYANLGGLSRKHIFDAVKNSVERLGTHIDVLQIHRLDKATPKSEIMRALNDVVMEGNVRYIGASAMKAVEFAQLQFIAEKNGWHKFISMQNFYNVLHREEEREMIPFCNDNEFGKIGLIPYSPLAKGLLSRPLGEESTLNRDLKNDKVQIGQFGTELRQADRDIIGRVEDLSKKYNVSMAAISINWLLSKGAAPIVGINKVERVDDVISATKFKLSEEDILYLEEPYVPRKPTT